MKASLLLDKIAERESIGATQEEVDREVQRIARQQREAVAVVAREAPERRRHRPNRRRHIRTEKTLNFLFEQRARKRGRWSRSQKTGVRSQNKVLSQRSRSIGAATIARFLIKSGRLRATEKHGKRRSL